MSGKQVSLGGKLHHPAGISWNKDGTQACIASENNVVIVDYKAGKTTIAHTLKSHKHRVTAVDWNHSSNTIVSSGEDRNAYVWNLEEGTWKPTLVLLRCNRAALCVKWSSSGDKFAVGTGAKSIMVCHFDEQHDFWVSKSIKKVKSSVLCIDWHPSNMMLAAGGADMKCRVFNAALDDLGESSADGVEGFDELNGSSFGQNLYEFGSMGFVVDCRWNGDGTKLAYASQSSQLQLVTFAGGEPSQSMRQLPSLPLSSCAWLKSYIVGGCHDRNMYKMEAGGNEIGEPELMKLSERVAKKKKKNNAFLKFQQLANTGVDSSSKKATTAVHTFPVSSLGYKGEAVVSVANGDEQMCIWNL